MKRYTLLLLSAAILLCCASCKKTDEGGGTSDPVETHVFAKARVVIKVDTGALGNQFLNLVRDSMLRCELYYGQELLVKLYDPSAFDRAGVCRDTFTFSQLPHRRQLRLEYRVPAGYSPKKIPCGLYLTVSASAIKIDKEGVAYGDFSPDARLLSHTYHAGQFSDTLMRRHLSEFNSDDYWVSVE